MKKIKFLGIIILTAVIVFGMASCGDGSDTDPFYNNDPADLIGSWYNIGESGDGKHTPLKRVETYKANGTIDSDLYMGEDFKDYVEKDSYSYKYSATKSTITYDFGDGEKYSCNYQIKGNKLTLYYEEDGEVEEEVWTRVGGNAPVYDNDPAKLVGSWYVFAESGDGLHTPLKRVETYKADGTIDSKLYMGEDFKDYVAKDSYSYKYSATKNKITYDFGEGEKYSCNYQIKGNKLTLYYEEDGEVEEEVWTRVE